MSLYAKLFFIAAILEFGAAAGFSAAAIKSSNPEISAALMLPVFPMILAAAIFLMVAVRGSRTKS